jgi:beta-mannosidase
MSSDKNRNESVSPRLTVTLDRGWAMKLIEPASCLSSAQLDAAAAPSGDDWLSIARMPAMVHTVLHEHARIETPWLPGRAESCRWVAEKDWIYAVGFAAADPSAVSWLNFRGLDTIVDVYLNGMLLATHRNQYLPLRVEVTEKLRDQNTLVLHFHSVFERADDKVRHMSQWNGSLIRRARYNYSTYLGPQPLFSRVGVYDDVVLEVSGGTEMTDVLAMASLDESLKAGCVTVDVAGPSKANNLGLSVRLYDPDGKVVAEAQKRLSTSEGHFASQAQLAISNPRLWWPRGYGDQPCYRVEVTLSVSGRPHQTEQRTLGFRRVTMPQQLHFVVNGVPVRLWGGDWVTPHWHTAVWDQTRVEQLFDMARHANFNAFRVWGRVEAPRDAFYELADSQGFLLWHDFTDLPLGADEISRTESCAEAEFLLKRLKHHPAIVAWCGDNEAAMWHHEEFNGPLEDRGQWPGLAAATDVAALVHRLDPQRYYQPSSPYFGKDPNEPQEGNTHGYTAMWYVPGYDYLNFASEDTRISAPVLASLKKFMAPEDIWPVDYWPVYAAGSRYPYPPSWLRYTTSTSWKKTGPVELFYDATDAASLVHRLGMAESLYYQETIERQRRGRSADDPANRRRCGGYLVWKFNESWPQVYSAKVDYFLEPYHAYYAIRRAFAPVLLSFEVGNAIWLWVVNDTTAPVAGTVKVQLFHLDQNKVRKEIVREVTVAPGRSLVVVRLDEAGVTSFRREHVLNATMVDKSGNLLAQATTLTDIERRVCFPQARLCMTIRGGELVMTSDMFARTVCLEGDAQGESSGWFFEDNYFDLFPGETRTVRILGRHTVGRIVARPWYSPHAAVVEWTKPA